MLRLNGTSGRGAALTARTVLRAARVNAFEPRCQSLETVRLFLGDGRDAVFLTQQMNDFLAENLPSKLAG